MHLTRLRVTNHSRLADLNIEVRKHLVLVGANDVGKSSLLRCLDMLLGASTAQLYGRITLDDVRDPEQPFIIEAELAAFDSSDKALFPDEITIDAVTGVSSLTLRLSATFDSNETLSVERTAPGGGTGRQVSREQLARVGWQLLSVARYQEIADLLRVWIMGGKDFEVGNRLPGIGALQEKYGVPSAGTIRQAQQILVHEGLIRTEQGSGAWVVSLQPNIDIMAELLELRGRLDRVIAAYTRENAVSS